MRDYILLYINGQEHRVSGKQAFIPITDYLRGDLAACGTKVVCAEGDCGACTVMIGRAEGGKLVYKPVNACIQYIFQLDCSHIITVEGLKVNGELNPIQEAMVECHGAQCGYCTPGFVVAMCAMADRRKCAEVSGSAGSGNGQDGHGSGYCPAPDVREIKEELTGNLCRCTGYEAIIKAGLEADYSKYVGVDELYPPSRIVKEFEEHLGDPVHIKAGGTELSVPVSVKEAAKFKQENPTAVIVTGGTDVGVNMNKKGMVPSFLISTSNLPGLDKIVEREEDGRTVLEVGARVSLRSLESRIQELDPELYYVLWVFGSPQIRNAGTLAGNIANGSPIADSLPFLFVMDAEVEVEGVSGSRRIAMTDLYSGYKQLTFKPGEMITRIHLPLPVPGEILKLYKLSRRQHLDISAFTAAIKLTVAGEIITSAKVAYGGVGPVVSRVTAVEEFLSGKAYSLETFLEAGRVARGAVEPISDVRGSRDYRLQLAENIMVKFWYETAEDKELACL